MEVVLLCEGTCACGQCERRTIAAIRDTKTSLHVLHCTTIGDIGTAGAGEAVDQEVLSTRGKIAQSKLDPYKMKGERRRTSR